MERCGYLDLGMADFNQLLRPELEHHPSPPLPPKKKEKETSAELSEEETTN